MALTSNYLFQGQTHKAPCGCTDCPDCSEWTTLDGDATYPLVALDNGNCYSRGKLNIAVVLPPVSTLRVGYFCITVRNTVLPAGNLYIRPFEDPGVEHMSIDGVLYDYMTVDSGGIVCVCWDGTNFVVTGTGASGWDGA